jgi:hypothetical protein
VSPSGTTRRADWASVADASSTRAVGVGKYGRRAGRKRAEAGGQGLGNIERWKYQRVVVEREARGVNNRLQDEVPDVVFETMSARSASWLPASALPNPTTLAQPSYSLRTALV